MSHHALEPGVYMRNIFFFCNEEQMRNVKRCRSGAVAIAITH